MERSQPKTSAGPSRGVLSRPLDALIFLLPLILLYEWASLRSHDRVIAFDLLRGFVELFGSAGSWAPGLIIITILLAIHVASGQPWLIRWRHVGLMYIESVVLAVPLLALNWSLPLAATLAPSPDFFERVGVGIGAGIYEEMVFRLVLISVLVMLGVDVFRMDRTFVAAMAVLVSSLVFAAHHHPPIGVEPFDAVRFAFRALAGAYLAVIFWYRGYGSAAGCHATYNVVVAAVSSP